MNDPAVSATSDSAWLQNVFEQNECRLLHYCTRLVGSLEAAQDVVQDAFVRLCAQERARIEPIVTQWLYTVCRNRALDIMKKENRMNPLSDERAAECPSREPDQAAALERRDDAHSAAQLMEQLPDRQRELIRLKIEGGLSYREMAEVTGLTVSNVGYLLHMGIKALRESMQCRIEAADA
ncbi:MAG: sigma-70 family RNA polymerase sigma factor [Planctomycetales bacterium]|nr:sigma-70 family RNA polymerase sigma factor [Planctomycetales bacterium]